ncbi:DUF1501 domain-containing protein [Parvularcula sp. LCG005]|uniref:DUF1501 domain-containing protein n=1 Tax=Parvularcula sp. LCG005 TaxID=3078805 RepID=UPI0029433743|nr:DUF1501 domain-containing protein [Parvularcula sp. LCG005]WOI52622.1 DUF1501 domain-containing protein [Parvularcula sp. LCG005]
MANVNRRQFLSGLSALGMAGSAGIFSQLVGSSAQAAGSGYKALVCLMLTGGMDHYDTILPADDISYNAYASYRGALLSAYGQGYGTRERARLNLLNASNISKFGGQKFGVPDDLAPLQALFNSGDAAVVGSVGPLIEPIGRDAYEAGRGLIPAQLYSHNDQRSTWMTFGTEGTVKGWGGRFADGSMAQTHPFSVVSAGGMTPFLTGDEAYPYIVRPNGPVPMVPTDTNWVLPSVYRNDHTRAVLEQHLASHDIALGNALSRDLARMNGRAIDAQKEFQTCWNMRTQVATSFPTSYLGAQLQTVAETIGMRNLLNVPRQVFFVQLPGFDTHSGQPTRLSALHSDLAESVRSFVAAMKELGTHDDVTLFTLSDFGRSMIDNGDGTDHGWGSHHFVVGGSVKGGAIYGDIPPPDLSLQNYTRSKGRLIPTTSVDQYAATLGAWFGLNNTDLTAALPNIGNFGQKTLGFL